MGDAQMATWTLVCLLALGQTPGDVTNQRSLKVPFGALSAEQRQAISELRLFASNDLGKSWQQVASARPDQDHFQFHAPQDGQWWFRAVVVDRQGKQTPENVYQGVPDTKILIDATQPIVRFTNAQRVGDEIAVAWEIKEEHANLKSLLLEYQMQDQPGKWLTVPVPETLKGEARFKPASAATLDLRMTI